MTVRTIDEIFRDFVTDGVPASGPFNPHKPDIRDTLKALLEGLSTFPDNRVIRLNNANVGTANNIVVTASVAIPAAAYQVLYILNVTQENAGPVKVSGAINRDLVTNTSRPIEPGYLKPGMALLCVDTGTQLRLLSYGDAEAILAAAEAAADRAEAAAEAAEAAAGSLSVNFETIASAKAANIPAVAKYILAAGRNSVGDGDGGMYVRVASPAMGSNIIQNGDFVSDTGWIKGTGWTIALGKASKAITASQSELGQTATLVAGEIYAVTFTIADYSGSGWVRPYFGYSGVTMGSERTANGTYTDYIAPVAGAGRVVIQAQATVACSIDNVSVRKVADAFQSADGAWWELRANVADKNVLTPSTPSMGISSTKIKDDLSGKFSGAVVRTVSDKFRDIVSARDFGAFGMGNDYTTELQTFLNQVKPTGLRAWIPRGDYGLSSTLLLNNQGIPGETPGVPLGKNGIYKRTAIVGDGAGETVFRLVGNIDGLHVQTGLGKAHHRGFSVVQSSSTDRLGIGILIDQSQALMFSDIEVKGCFNGITNRDSFSINYTSVDLVDNINGFVGENVVSGSHPNAINFNSVRFMDNTGRGCLLTNPTTCNFFGGSFEGNGVGNAVNGGLEAVGASNEGSFGINVFGTYFENNYGGFDVRISNFGSGTRAVIHRIKGCTFNRISSTRFTTNNIRIDKVTAGFQKVIASENAFNGFNSYVPNSGRKYIVNLDSGAGSTSELIANDNLYGSSVETP